MAYSPLPIETVDLDNLVLDLDNYRIPTAQTSEVEAMEHLFVSEDVMSLMKLILQNGYFDNEIPVVYTSDPDNGYTVLEGNRRTCALRTLANPAAVPRYEKEIRSLLKRYAEEAKNLPGAIRVMIAPTREEAEPHIARLHTGLPKKRWTLDQQAKFYYSRLSKTTSVDDLKALYPSIKIVPLIKMASMRRFVFSAPFTDQSLRHYAASNDLKMSSLEYAYRTREIAEAVGAFFTKDGLLEPVSMTPQQIGAALRGQELQALEYLLTEFRAGRLDTRSDALKKSKQYDKARNTLIQTLRGFIPATPAPTPGTPQSETAAHGSTPASDHTEPGAALQEWAGGAGSDPGNTETQEKNGPQTRGQNRPSTKIKLDFTGIDYSTVHVNLQHRYYELRTINVVVFPIAASMLMRSVLEATIKAHFESSNMNVSGMLGDVFKAVTNTYGKDRGLRDHINKVSSGSAITPGTLLWLNYPPHNADTFVTGADVHEAWRLITPILRHLLRPAVPAATP